MCAQNLVLAARGVLLTAALGGASFICGAPVQSTPPAGGPASTATSRAVPGARNRFVSQRMQDRVTRYYQGLWGVDSLSTKLAESGELVRFSYRVVDPAKAAPLNDKKSEPSLIDPQAGVSLVIPSVQNVGKLRQTSAPIAGKSYWMTFSNQGRPVKRGDRVTVVIGRFKAEGLLVE